MKRKKRIGRIESACFKLLGLLDIDVKVDTGAFTSSIHCENIKVVDKKLYCQFLDEAHPQYNHKQLVFDNFSIKTVRSSNGISEERYVIETIIKLGRTKYPIELTLTDRKEMKYPVLLGRKFLAGRFIVDVSKTYKLDKSKRKNEEEVETSDFIEES